ncbi:MAG: CalY family protein [Clostridium sp.]|nr:CalY family protein [Clostridium sp.]
MINKDKMTLFVTGMFLLLIMTTGLSYAYFSASVKGNENAKDMVVEAGTLSLVYTDGPEIKAQNIKPGWSTTKEVSVKNNGTLGAYYNVIWQSLTNTITNNELVLSATCQRLNASGTVEGTCESMSQAPISDMTIAKKISIESGITHKYTFTILFKETNADQNYNQGKEFNGVLGIEEYKAPDFATDSWSTIIANVKAGNGNEYAVGSTKEVDLGTTYGTHTLRVANTSTPSECSGTGFSQTACGFVLEFADIITTHDMNPSGEYNGTSYIMGWNKDGWPASSMYTFVNNDIYNAIPSEIKNAIIDTTVVSGHGAEDTKNFTSTDKLYLLAPGEIYSDWYTYQYTDDDIAKDLTRTLDYYTAQGITTSNESGAIKKDGTSAANWWLRTASSSYTDCFFSVDDLGIYYNGGASNTSGVAPAFRLG